MMAIALPGLASLVGDDSVTVLSFSVPAGLLSLSVMLALAAAAQLLIRRSRNKKPVEEGH